MKYRNVNIRIPQPEFGVRGEALRRWLPTKGNALFTILFTFSVVASLFWAQSAGAFSLAGSNATSSGTIAYQGRLADASGNPLTDTLNMSFRLYPAAAGGTALWTEQWTGPNGVQVSDGLFNVMLGSLTPIPRDVIAQNSNLFLGITVGTDDEMGPRVQLGSVPFAVQALTVPDGSITAAKLNLNDGLTVNGNLAVNGEIKGTYFCGGHTNTDGTGWVLYGNPGSNGIYIDVDTSGCNFPSTPMYFASLGGLGAHWTTTGATSIYAPTATGFRIYIRGTDVPINPTIANDADWYIQWFAAKQKTTGLDNGSYLP